jgi:integrase
MYAAGDTAGLNGEGRQPVGLHDLRHSFVSNSLERISLPKVSAFARHASARVTTQVYAGLAESGLKEAARDLAETGFGA